LVLDAHAEIHAPSKQGSAQSFSAQELLDCVPNPRHCGGSGGCGGATIELAFDWAINHGLATERENPYNGSDGTCLKSGGRGSGAALQLADRTEDLTAVGVHLPARHDSSFLGSRPSGPRMRAWERLPENEQEPLVRALVERGPVGVSVAAGEWFLYASGVFDSCSADAVIDHAVTLIGIGVQKGQKFWLIQNSWGPGWGERGRIKLLRRDDDNERCGYDDQPEVGLGCDGGPARVRVCGMCGVLYDSTVPHFVQ
jgi:cathepsin L